ncbi:anhydro-N-acetylmuramic acid kinase [Pseudobacter ginsenosidimutans]|uniref:Anhydro-N-acetylmuramic acid kinase n=1 Tax=Pseudobacter ginsenosidimutans TaxID=661488 RepID=A0A4Q7MU99_9BACT|nr:anhydro-N-acetylmuramic acid kinase [Pseudobacter ginsenosidimutans]QEC40804.1 anhydro-N-acetylmuramic acid kinase [Pseudobacter ginsenosidimutans]RZS72466.1 anhydro-N-acetylmuramic acid kinase [Pseudobacter ginsenosidimutans]
MVYRVLGLMSGSALDGLDIVFVEFQENGGKWQYEIIQGETYPYEKEWVEKLRNAINLKALDYQLLDVEYGHYTAAEVNKFINKHGLDFKVQLIASHGHTTFHVPSKKMTAQLGDGASIAAATGINVVSDLRAIDMALHGHGAPIVPIGEKLLLNDYDLFLNIGGIMNLSYRKPDEYIAYDVCPANRVMNMMAQKLGKEIDYNGDFARSGKLQPELLNHLNALEYYKMPYPKSLANDFGTDVIFPMAAKSGYSIQDGLRTFVEHMAEQLKASLVALLDGQAGKKRILVTGGGAHNTFLIERLTALLQEIDVEVVVPDKVLVDFKEALIMGLIGVLRWREEINVMSTVTGADRDSIGGAVWMGQPWN